LLVTLITVQPYNLGLRVEDSVLSLRGIRVVKPEIRVLGVDDGEFIPRSKAQALIVGVVFRGGYWLEGVMHTEVEVDGFDATNKLSAMITSSPHHRQLRVVMLNGITFAGFNVVDIKALNKETGLPVIAVTREKPDLAAIRDALGNLPESEVRWKAVVNAGEVFEVSTRSPRERIYIHVAGVSLDAARRIVRLTSTRSSVPEALRVAHLVASGISHS
jgi:endonuclease V-like protein UPF0215 family